MLEESSNAYIKDLVYRCDTTTASRHVVVAFRHVFAALQGFGHATVPKSAILWQTTNTLF